MNAALDAGPALWIERDGAARGDPGALPLACLHGWGLNLRVWDALRAPLCAGGRELLLIDLPGHGRSPFAPLRASLDAQVESVLAVLPERVALLGWSLGGQFALALAARAPTRIAQLILVATTPRFVAGGDWNHGLPPMLLERFAARLEGDYRLTVSDFLELQVRGSRDAEEILRTLRRALLEHGEAQPAALLAGLGILRSTDLRAGLGELRQPTLVISGQYDRVTPPAAGQALAAALPQATYRELARAAHAPFLSHTREFVACVEGFLGRGP